jgi:hypothetical protein
MQHLALTEDQSSLFMWTALRVGWLLRVLRLQHSLKLFLLIFLSLLEVVAVVLTLIQEEVVREGIEQALEQVAEVLLPRQH